MVVLNNFSMFGPEVGGHGYELNGHGRGKFVRRDTDIAGHGHSVAPVSNNL